MTPPTRQRLRDVAALARRKGRDATGELLVEGVRSVEAAVAAGAPLVEAFLSTEAAATDRVRALAAALAAAGVPAHVLPAREVDRLGDARSSQGAVAVARRVVREGLPEGLPEGVRRVVLLDGVQDPGNVGAVVRTAAWFGADAVVADAACADPEGPKAVRASMGGVWDVALVRVPALVPVLDALAARGVPAWGADLGGTPVGAWAPPAASALVLGSEAHGLSAGVAAWLRAQPAGGFVTIPRAPRAPRAPRGGVAGVESLNVVVAAGVLLARWAA